jgi:KaiC/GvpD/RAD55 family RecA-like ATPase
MSEQAPYYARRPESNGKTNLYAIAGQAFEIETQYRNCAEILFAAILREPHNFATHAGRMHQIWWEDTQYKKAAQAVWKQYYGPSRSYSVPSVCQAAGIGDVSTDGGLTVNGVYAVMNAHIETDTTLALEMFEPVYRQWVEHRCSLFVGSGIANGMGAEQIRAQQDAFRNERRAYVEQSGTKDEWFERWFELKMAGYEIDYKCKPSLECVRNSRMMVGYEPGTLYVLAGVQGTGKTYYIICDMLKWVREGARGVFVTLDMNYRQLRTRIIGMLSGYTHDDDWSILTDQQRQKIVDAKVFVDNLPILVLDRDRGINEIIATCYGEHYREKIDFLVIDFIQKVTAKAGNRSLEIGEIMGKLKVLANTLDIPVVVLSQLNRAVEIRGGSKRPQLSDLKESGSIETDADVVTFLYRPEMYGILENEKGESLKALGEIIFAKQRMRKTGVVLAGFDENGIKGWHDLEENHDQGQTIERPTYTDYNVPASARPMSDEDIPF